MDAVLNRYFPKMLHFSLSQGFSRSSKAPSRNSSASVAVLTSENAAFGSFSQTARSSAVTVSHPNRNMYRPGSVTRPTYCQVTLSTNHFFPCEVCNRLGRRNGDSRRHASPERSFTRPHFEGVELQGERRQRQPQIIELFGPRGVALVADCACSVTRSTTGNCKTVTRCPSQSCVTSTWLPSGNSIASW